jgi:hypothetical protein
MYKALLYIQPIKFLIILMATLATILTANAQQLQCSKELALTGVKTVVIESLDGSSVLEAYSGSSLQISAAAKQQGDTWGWRQPDERPPFAIKSRRENDTLYIKMPREFTFNTVGISTYSESLSNYIKIPETVSVIIKQAEKLAVSGALANLQVLKAEKIKVEGISAQTIKQLVATAQKPVKVNQKPTTTTYTLSGSGLANYSLKATSIQLNPN